MAFREVERQTCLYNNRLYSYSHRIGIIPSGLPPFLRQKLMSLDLVMVPIDLRKWSTLPEYMKLTEIFQRITKHIEKYKEIANAKPRN